VVSASEASASAMTTAVPGHVGMGTASRRDPIAIDGDGRTI
jgi:hypothetical protein